VDEVSGRSPAQRWLVAEILLLAFLGAARRLEDPARLLAWIFGPLPDLPFGDFQPWQALVVGIRNLLLAAAVGCFFVKGRLGEGVRATLAAYTVLVLCVIPVLADVELRINVDDTPGNTAPYVSATHDGGVLQVEMATAALLRGEDPYRISYDRTPMTRSRDSAPEGWRLLGYDHNPAADHLTYPPGVLYLSTPFDWLARRTLGFYDARLLYLLAAFALAAVLATLVPAGPTRRMVVVGALANPLLTRYLEVGRNDVLVLLALAAFSALLLRQRWRGAAIALGAALCVKQFALPVVPFFLVAVYLRERRSIRSALRIAWPVAALPLLAAAPFLVTDPAGLLDDLFLWFQGGGNPVRWDGYGLTPLAYGLGLVEDAAGPNPYGFLAAPLLLASVAGLGVWVWRLPTPGRVLIASGVWVFAVFFTARQFSGSYLAVPVLLWATALLDRPPPPAGASATDEGATPAASP
jgi:hypothetical protein